MAKKDLYLSPTQFSQYQDCHRSWWFQRVHKLKRKTTRSQAFGTVLHGVVERYLKSTPENEADLYPSGWNVVDEHGQKHVMGVEEMERIKFLFDQSVEKGVLVRQPGKQLIEEKRFMELIPGVRQVLVPDIMDLDDEGRVWRIQDCKTAGGTKFLEKPQSIMGNEQLLSYGLVALDIGIASEGLIFRHNQFIRNEKASPVPVRAVDSVGHVREFEITRFANSRKDMAKNMLALRDADIEEEDWLKVPAMQAPDACEKYGPCSFAQICTKALRTVGEYREMRANETSDTAEGDMLGKFRKRRIGVPAQPKKPKDMAAPFAKANKASKKKTSTKPTTKAPIGRPSGKEESKPEPEQGTVVAPWAVASCNACGGTGINKRTGNPCKVCDVANKRNGDERAEDFNAVVEDGVLTWDGQDEAEEVLASVDDPAAEPEEEPEEEEEEPEEEEEEEEEEPEPEEEEEPEPEPKATKKTTKRATKKTARKGPKPQGLFLFIGCVPVIGRMANSGTVPLAQVFGDLQEEFSEATGNGYWEADAFQRRDWIASNAEAIKEKLGTLKVFVPLQLSPDEQSLLGTLRGIATEVFEATRS